MHLTGKCILRALKMAQVCSQCSSNHRYCGTIYSIRVGAYVLSMKSVENRSVKIQHTNVMLLSAIFRIYLFTVNHALIVCSCLFMSLTADFHCLSLTLYRLVGVCVWLQHPIFRSNIISPFLYLMALVTLSHIAFLASCLINLKSSINMQLNLIQNSIPPLKMANSEFSIRKKIQYHLVLITKSNFNLFVKDWRG